MVAPLTVFERLSVAQLKGFGTDLVDLNLD